MIAGTAAGICIGALPGLTATMGVALLLPLTFGMDATSGILMLLGIYVGAIYGGSISAVLLHTPGTPASAATAIDGYEFTKRGEAGRALGIATMGSYVGGIVSCICLLLISPQLAKLALKFSSAEFFLLALFGLCIISNISGHSTPFLYIQKERRHKYRLSLTNPSSCYKSFTLSCCHSTTRFIFVTEA